MPPTGDELTVVFGWFANYLLHAFVRTWPADPTHQTVEPKVRPNSLL